MYLIVRNGSSITSTITRPNTKLASKLNIGFWFGRFNHRLTNMSIGIEIINMMWLIVLLGRLV